jgi:hypothetical protein
LFKVDIILLDMRSESDFKEVLCFSLIHMIGQFKLVILKLTISVM